MLKRVLFMMITLFSLMVANAVSEEYEYTLFQEIDDELIAIDKPYSCSTIYDLIGGAKNATLTPVFGCAFGYEPIDSGIIYSTTHGDFCKLRTITCYPGYYLYVNESENIFECRSCPRGSFCPGGNENILSKENLGIIECPAGTTTGATANTGTNARFVEQCSWYKCNPGQKLSVTDGVASCEPCDQDHYCVGGVYDIIHADESMRGCPTKIYAGTGTSESGSFRCSYTCPAGKAMEVIGAWYRADSDCVPCPKGYYCPGDTSASEPDYLQNYFTPTVYSDDMNAGAGVEIGYHGAIKCEEGKTTFGLESTKASECTEEHSCEPGEYLDIAKHQCMPCSEITKDDFRADIRSTVDLDLVYCPGGRFTEVENPETPNKVGVYQCPQYFVKEQGADKKWTLVFDLDDVDVSSPYYNKYKAKDNQTRCECPNGYNWNQNTQTCCEPGRFCCPRGMEVYTAKNGKQMCQTCSNKFLNDQGSFVEDGKSYYCPGTTVEIPYQEPEVVCEPTETQYLKGKECIDCAAGAVQNTNGDGCVCTKEKLDEAYPNDLHDRDEDFWWDEESNLCKPVVYRIIEKSTYRHLDGSLTQYVSNLSTYDYGTADYTFPLSTPYVDGYEFVGWKTYYSKNEPEDTVLQSPDTPIEIMVYPKLRDDIILETVFNQQLYTCEPGYYLAKKNSSDGTSAGCKVCPKGHYCPGGSDLFLNEADSTLSNIGLYPCPIGTYNPDTGVETDTGCRPCASGVAERLNITVPEDNKLTTEQSAASSVDACGYTCSKGYFDAGDGAFKCDQPCPEGFMCPGYAFDEWGGMLFFIPYTMQGEGKIKCPVGATSDGISSYCYKHCDGTYYAKLGLDGSYECSLCDGNIPAEHEYYYCPGGDIVIEPEGIVRTSEGGIFEMIFSDNGKRKCASNELSDEPASGCYEDLVSGTYVNNFGAVGECLSNAYCPGGTTQGMIQCPLGSISEPGSGSVFDCKCLSDTDLEEGVSAQHRPNDVYAEKGAGLYKVANNEYICANSYLVVGDGTSYEHPGTHGEIPTADARVVACEWGSDSQTAGKYDKCTEKAMRICDKDDWADSETGLVSNNISTTDVMNTLADAFGMTLSGSNIFNTVVSSIAGIMPFGDACQIDCPVGYSHYSSDENYCYAVIDFNTNGGTPVPEPRVERYDGENMTYKLSELPEVALNGYSLVGWYDNAEFTGDAVTTETELSGDKTLYAKWNEEMYSITYNGIADANVSGNPDSYTIESADITLNNPTKEDYEFLGWCDDEGLSENCLTEKTIWSGSTGDKEFWAKWQAIGCPEAFPEGTVDDCYAMITYKNMEGAVLSEGASNPSTYNAETELPIGLHNPTKDNYTFLGWCDDADLTLNCSEEKTIPAGSTGHKVFWAKWEPRCDSHKYLHIGDNAICLYETKPTSPALVVMSGDTKYYAHMCTDCDKTMNGATGSKLHIKYNNKTYNVYDLTAQ